MIMVCGRSFPVLVPISLAISSAASAQVLSVQTNPSSQPAWSSFVRAGSVVETQNVAGGVPLGGSRVENAAAVFPGDDGACALHIVPSLASGALTSVHVGYVVGNAVAATGGDPLGGGYDETLLTIRNAQSLVVELDLSGAGLGALREFSMQIDLFNDGSIDREMTVTQLADGFFTVPIPPSGSQTLEVLVRERVRVESDPQGSVYWLYAESTVSTSGTAPPAPWMPIGLGCTGAGTPIPVLDLVPGSQLAIGSVFELTVSNVDPTTQITGLIGFEPRIGGPLILGPIGLPGCVLFIESVLTQSVPAGPSSVRTWALQLPNDTGLRGLDLYQQAFVFAPGANPLGGVLSNAGFGEIL